MIMMSEARMTEQAKAKSVRRDKTINIKPYVGDDYLVTLNIPSELAEGSDEEWEFICFWIDYNLDVENVAEWEQ